MIAFLREGVWLARAGYRAAKCLALLAECEPW